MIAVIIVSISNSTLDALYFVQVNIMFLLMALCALCESQKQRLSLSALSRLEMVKWVSLLAIECIQLIFCDLYNFLLVRDQNIIVANVNYHVIVLLEHFNVCEVIW